MGEDNKVFKKGDILEFTIFMKDPKLNYYQIQKI